MLGKVVEYLLMQEQQPPSDSNTEKISQQQHFSEGMQKVIVEISSKIEKLKDMPVKKDPLIEFLTASHDESTANSEITITCQDLNRMRDASLVSTPTLNELKAESGGQESPMSSGQYTGTRTSEVHLLDRSIQVDENFEKSFQPKEIRLRNIPWVSQQTTVAAQAAQAALESMKDDALADSRKNGLQIQKLELLKENLGDAINCITNPKDVFGMDLTLSGEAMSYVLFQIEASKLVVSVWNRLTDTTDTAAPQSMGGNTTWKGLILQRLSGPDGEDLLLSTAYENSSLPASITLQKLSNFGVIPREELEKNLVPK